LDVGKEAAGHAEEAAARRLDRELATRDLDRRREVHAGGGEADRVLRPDFQRSVEIESDAGWRDLENLPRLLPADLQLVLLRLELLGTLAGRRICLPFGHCGRRLQPTPFPPGVP